MAAEEKETEGAAKPGTRDPICDRSLAWHFFLASGLLALTVAWSLADEILLRRPYKGYQSEFQSLALRKGEHELAAADAELTKQKQSEAYKQAAAELDKASQAYQAWTESSGKELRKQFDELGAKLNDTRGEFQVKRGEYQPLVYEYDHARHEGHESEASAVFKEMKKVEPEIQKIFERLVAESNDRKALQGKITDARAPVEAAQKALQEKVPAQKRVADAKLRIEGAKGLDVGVLKPYQIYSPAMGAIDRCTSCHVATDKPGYTEADWDAAKGPLSEHEIAEAKKVFTTHPNFLSGDPAKLDYIGRHNPSVFGCTSCHWGNGPATTSPHKAHGLEHEARESWTHPMEFQLTPLMPLGSLEAVRKGEQHFGNLMDGACAKCHVSEVSLKGAPQLSAGRQLVEDLGCWGCHKIKGFELKEQELQAVQDRVSKELEPEKARLRAEVARLLGEGESALDERQALAKVTHEIQVSERRARELDHEVKFIGPDLNRKAAGAGLKDKIYWAWLPRWISSPQHFRPGTWMPNPLLANEEVLDVAAYIWQQAAGTATDEVAWTAPTDPKVLDEGRRLVQTRGCLACHTLEDRGTPQEIEPLRPKERDGMGEKFAVYNLDNEGKDEGKGGWWESPKTPIPDGGRADLFKAGERFGPSLARVGEKIRYEWLVAWVLDPKSIQPHTRMPDLRLERKEGEAIAAFLTTLRKEQHPGGAKYATLARAELESADRAAKGFRLVVRNGCFNCHAVDLKDPTKDWAPIANPGKIGAELSSHGSKPLAQFDFGFLKIPMTRNVWLQTKIMEPRIFDRGKYKGDPNDRLRMPRFGLNAPEAAAVTTVLAGLTDQVVPAQFVYQPGPGTREGAIIEGERLVRKFNCRSCHVIDGEGQWAKPQLLTQIAEALKLPNGEDDAPPFLPPILNGQGHRSNPDWLFKFLKNPGEYQPLRPWHVLRMPTFEMSDAEAIALVQYFSALEKERFPYEAKEEAAPDPKLIEEGRTMFVKAECWQCHRIGEYEPKGKQPIEQGPNFRIARERLRADWIERFIPDPQAFIPGAKMPSFFQSRPFALQSPESQRQIQALTAYLRELASPEFQKAENWTATGRGPGVR